MKLRKTDFQGGKSDLIVVMMKYPEMGKQFPEKSIKEVLRVVIAVKMKREKEVSQRKMRRIFMKNPYEICPTFETESFILRLVSEEDSEDLLKCYSDSKAQKIFNSDKCTGDFCIYTIEDMLQCIKAWLCAYSQQEFIRFAIIDKSLSKAIGTVEMFGYTGKYKIKTGILRVDVSSEYENADYLNEIFSVCNENFFDLFEVDMIATKAIPQAVERRNTLLKIDFCEGNAYEGEHYFLRSK